jgi:hypothetical protein
MSDNNSSEPTVQQQVAKLLDTVISQWQLLIASQARLEQRADAAATSQEDIKQRLVRIEALLKASTPAPIPTPTLTFEQQLAAAPDATARLNLAFNHFNIDRGDFKAMNMTSGNTGIPYLDVNGGPLNGIHRLLAPNYAPAILDIVKRYNEQHALKWNFTPKDLLAVEIQLLTNTGILATISYSSSYANGQGPWKTSSLPSEIQSAITKGKQGGN